MAVMEKIHVFVANVPTASTTGKSARLGMQLQQLQALRGLIIFSAIKEALVSGSDPSKSIAGRQEETNEGRREKDIKRSILDWLLHINASFAK